MATPSQLGAILLIALLSMSAGIYLQYLILEKIEASEVMWFLFVINIPLFLTLTVAREALVKR